MPSHALRALVVAVATVPLVATATAPATATTTGEQSFYGFILTSGKSGHREVVASPVIAKGVFDGVGRIVEVKNRPGDPDSVSRDNLVFRAGTMHLVSRDRHVSAHLNPKTCRVTVDIRQTNRIVGGSRAFTDASGRFVSEITGSGKLARKSNGACNERVEPLRTLAVITVTGRLAY